MKRATRPVLATILASSLALFAAMAPVTAQAGSDLRRPGEMAMIADALIARPVLLLSTVVGTGLFVVTSPFSLLGGNVKEAGNVLVMKPAKSTFVRCLGCTPAQHESLKAEKLLEKGTREAEREAEAAAAQQ